jgi:hypothetical protein
MGAAISSADREQMGRRAADLGTLMKNQGPVSLNPFFTIAGKK